MANQQGGSQHTLVKSEVDFQRLVSLVHLN